MVRVPQLWLFSLIILLSVLVALRAICKKIVENKASIVRELRCGLCGWKTRTRRKKYSCGEYITNGLVALHYGRNDFFLNTITTLELLAKVTGISETGTIKKVEKDAEHNLAYQVTTVLVCPKCGVGLTNLNSDVTWLRLAPNPLETDPKPR